MPSGLEHGGRLYGGFWQQLPSGKKGQVPSRKDILINGQPTIELDYQALHINMLYALSGQQPLQDDPYDNIDGYERELVKACMLIAINCKTKSPNAIIAKLESEPDLIQYLPSMKGGGYNKLKQAFLAKHPTITPYLHADMGTTLQRKDSDIAIRVIEMMMHLPKSHLTSEPIPVLCVHDSFICPAQYKNELKSCMIGAFEQVMRTTRAPIVK